MGKNFRHLPLLLALFGVLVLPTLGQQGPPGIWLLQPPARLLENGPASQRLPERTCPTPSTEKDPLTSLPAGIPFRVQWHDPEQLPVELAKLELFSSDGGHLLTRLDMTHQDGAGGADGNNSVSTLAQLPAGLRCASCVLRLSVELDERIQLLSCAQVRVQPVQLDDANKEAAECAADGDCGGNGGECVEGQCFCSEGRFGERCEKENTSPIATSSTAQFQQVRFPSGAQFRWQANGQQNALRMGLTIPATQTSSTRWFILGLQSTEVDPMCQQAMTLWKQRNSHVAANNEDDENAKARAGVVIRVEQDKDNQQNPMTGAGPKEGGDEKRPSKLNIHRIPENGTNGGKECGQNQRWESCPETSRECEPSCDWTLQPELIPSCPARSADQCGKPRCVCAEGFVRLGNQLDECKPFEFCQAPEVMTSEGTELPPTISGQQQCPVNQTWEKCGTACEPSCQSMYSEEPCGSACEASGCTCADSFVRSDDGRCIQWSECPNLKERIASSSNASSKEVTRGPSVVQNTVSIDETTVIGGQSSEATPGTCGANETLNECGRICEADCDSIFEREECQKCGQPACSCRQGFARFQGMCLYWGDCPPSISPSSTTLLTEKPDTSTPSSTRTTAAGRHSGHVGSSTTLSGKQTTTSVATEEPPMDLCRGAWNWPAGCQGTKCLYSLQWRFEERTDSLHFTLETRPAVSRKMAKGEPIWSGVGFSPSGTLLDADMIVLEASEDGKIRPLDMHVDEQLEQLRQDRQQDVQGQGQFSGGVLKAEFWRKRRTGDAAGQDLEFADEGNCFRFLFPVSGGRFEQSGNTSVPVADSLYASDAEICVRACKGDKPTPKPTISTNDDENEQQQQNCQQEFRWPEGCKDEQCEYRARWAWQPAGDNVQFNISSRGIGRWTGIGFSRDGRMSGSDIVTGWVFDQKAYLTDRFAYAQQQPAIDPVDRQDLFDVSGSLVDDIQTISFRRPVLSPDRTTDLPLADCIHFLFPVQGGRVLARSSRDFQQARTPIGFHDQQPPIASERKICLCERPKDFHPPEKRKFGRAKRATEQEEQGGPYQCADIAIFQVSEDGRAIRVVDAFGLSNDSLRRDEHWGGQQSLDGVEIQKDGAQMTIWVRKAMKDSTNENADLTVRRGQIPVFLASGQGPMADMSKTERLEFAMVDLMAGAVEGNAIGSTTIPSSSTTNTRPTSTTPSTTPSSTSSTTTTASTSRTSLAAMETTAIPIEETTEVEAATEGIDADDTDGKEPQVVPAPAFQPGGEPGDQPAVEFMDENCFGGFAHPEGCMQPGQQNNCQYTLEWLVHPQEGKVEFQLNARMPADHWTGIGFSPDGAMANADALIVLLLPDGQVSVQDQFSPGYGVPSIDLRQNVQDVSSRSSDGLWSVNFSRPLATDDTAQDVDLRQCQHFLFLHSANPLVPGSGQLRKHVETPVISESRICLGKCGQKMTIEEPFDHGDLESPAPTTREETTVSTTTRAVPSTSTTTARSSTTTEEATTAIFVPTPDIVKTAGNTGGDNKKKPVQKEPESRNFNIAIRMPNERWDPRLEDPESEAFGQLAQKLQNSLTALISARWPSLASLQVQKFAEGSVLALLQAQFNGTSENTELPDGKQLKQFLQEAAAQGMPSELIMDREMLEVQDGERTAVSEEDKWGPLREIQGWILAMLGLLLLLTIIGALLFCAFRSRRKRRGQHRTYPTKQSLMMHNNPHNPHGNGGGGMLFTNGGGLSGYHQGHYAPFPCEKDRESDTTTAKTSTTNGHGLNNGNGKQSGRRTETPRGIGEATYREWFSKVASKDAPSHYQEHWQMPPPTPLPRAVPTAAGAAPMPAMPASPYLSYPNDPAFYTLNGEHRIVPPPPAYYRPF